MRIIAELTKGVQEVDPVCISYLYNLFSTFLVLLSSLSLLDEGMQCPRSEVQILPSQYLFLYTFIVDHI